MGTLYLVRHGQASFGAADYDKLSELGHRQSVRLGEHFAQKGLRFDAVMAGTLRRHLETLAGIREGMQHQGEHLPWEGLNEYDSEAIIATVHPEKLQKPTSPEMYRAHFRLLRDGLAKWMAGVVSPQGMPSYEQFVDGVASALDHVRRNHHGGNVQRRPDRHCRRPGAGHQQRNHHRAEPAHPQHLGDRIRLHAQAPHAGELQHDCAPGAPRLRELGHVFLRPAIFFGATA
jgi:broad specificity phosphatase PhoE